MIGSTDASDTFDEFDVFDASREQERAGLDPPRRVVRLDFPGSTDKEEELIDTNPLLILNFYCVIQLFHFPLFDSERRLWPTRTS